MATTIPFPARLAPLPGVSHLAALGGPALLDRVQIALFCSVRCPAAIILKTYDLAQQWRAQGVGVISGFHSPIEQEALTTLLRGHAPVVVCPARSIHTLRVPAAWKPHIDAGRLLVVSPFAEAQKRATQPNADLRNRLVAALAPVVFIAYAAPGGKTEAFARSLLAAGKPVQTFASADTQNLLDLGAQPVEI